MENKLPKVRYVIPSYNQGVFIKSAIESVLNQNYGNLELVVMDGGSKDCTIDVLQSFDDSRFFWESSSDRGQTDAILKGFDFTTEGDFEYFNWLGSDDLLYSANSLSRLVSAAEETQADLVYGEGEYINVDGKPTGKYGIQKIDLDSIESSCGICQPSVLIRKSSYLKSGGLNISLKSIMDYDLWIKMYDQNCKFVMIPDLISKYRIHEDGKTSYFRYQTYREILEMFSRRGKRVSSGFFNGAFEECIKGAYWGVPFESPNSATNWESLLRRTLYFFCKFTTFQDWLARRLKPSKYSYDPLGFTRSYSE